MRSVFQSLVNSLITDRMVCGIEGRVMYRRGGIEGLSAYNGACPVGGEGGEIATAAVGTHPIGMNSFFCKSRGDTCCSRKTLKKVVGRHN